MIKMKKLLLITLLVLLPTIVFAFPFIKCDPASDVDEIQWRWRVAGASWSSWMVGVVETVPEGIKLNHDLAPISLPDGDLEFQARGKNMWGYGPNSETLQEKKSLPSQLNILVGE